MDTGGASVQKGRNRRFIAGLIIICLAAVLTVSAYAETKPLGMDLTTHGMPLRDDGWVEPGVEYRDESIHAVLTKDRFHNVYVRTIVIEIADASQLRSTLSYENFEDQRLARSLDMAKSVNALAAVNDDFVKFNKFQGYVMRQGVFYQDTLEKLEKPQDVLIIDNEGDFYVVIKASTGAVESKLAELKENNREPVNIFTFGPTLVLDGQPLDCPTEDSIHSMHLKGARAVIGQLDHLKYFIMTVDGAMSEGTGMTGNQLAGFIAEHFPECKVAYNLDGGNSSKLIFGGKELNSARGQGRKISGLIYFASAATEE